MPVTINGTTGISTPGLTNSSGDMTITNGNLVIGTSGKGIDFSATSGTGTSELLSDYEEGTWTPVLATFTGTSGRTVTGRYTKIGRLVYVNVKISAGSDTLVSTGNVSAITGLPFTVSGNSAFAGITNNYLDTINQGCGIYVNETIIYTVAFSFASNRVINISGIYEV